MSEVRRQILSWSASRRTSALERLFSLEEILSLGGGSAGNAWGTFNEPISGCYCLAFPDGTAWETFAGRPGLGLVSARVADVTLRLAELFVEIGAPAVLLPGALAYTLQDLIDEAPSMHTDDWDALVQHAHALDRVRVEDYIAGVAARGPLTLERRP
jgi:hypothetical protein